MLEFAIVLKNILRINLRPIYCLTSKFHVKFYAKKTISHVSRSDECDIG